MKTEKKTVLITAFVDDVHAAAVSEALEVLGHRALLCNTSNFPERSTLSIEAGGSSATSGQLLGEDFSLDEVNISWFRRLGPPVISKEINSSDRFVALRETKVLIDGFLALLSESCFSVNGFYKAMAAESKPFQLRVAESLGFHVPNTLISNNPERIRKFLAHEPSAIYKPFIPASWDVGQGFAVSLTVPVSLADLPSDSTLQLSPGIFQKRIDKACELRIICMGARVIAVRLDSQRLATSVEDWRAVPCTDLLPELITLPAEIEHQCRLLMRSLGLVFGCIDMIVDKNENYIFLEVNQMGQFLWIEYANPEIKLLDTFVSFLLSEDPDYKGVEESIGLRYADFGGRGIERIKRARGLHNFDYTGRVPLPDKLV